MSDTGSKGSSSIGPIGCGVVFLLLVIVIAAVSSNRGGEDAEELRQREQAAFWERIREEFDGVATLQTLNDGFGWGPLWQPGMPAVSFFKLKPDRGLDDYTRWSATLAIDANEFAGRTISVDLIAVFEDPETGRVYLEEAIGRQAITLVQGSNRLEFSARIPRHQLKSVTIVKAQLSFVPN